jgi:two-component system sensor histidine kinase SenX3
MITGALIVLLWMRAHRSYTEKLDLLQPSVPPAAIAILDELDLFAVVLDKSFSVVYANAAAIEHESIPPEMVTSEEFIDQAKHVYRTGEVITQFGEDDPDGIWSHLFRLDHDFVVLLADDRSEEMRLNAMRRDFIANMSHELKTPVSSLGLLAEAMSQASDEPERVATFSKRMVKESRRLAELTNDIILLSEAQSEPKLEELVEIDLRQIVEDEIAEHENFAQQRDVTLVLSHEPRGQGAAEKSMRTIARPQAASVAVANILSNAIKHSPRESRVGVAMEAEGDWVSILVTDQGEGIEPENIDRVFERFYRVDNARTREEGGTGLGLSIVRHTMLTHGGSVSVWSKPGVGSTFTLRFPRLGSDLTTDKILINKKKKRKHKK